ncbi:MAG TPA: hypothetical protein VMI32_12750 [Candidatus Solibacter sp.]|nr:hypothetical protein [Candidatus Solibacter sp.]
MRSQFLAHWTGTDKKRVRTELLNVFTCHFRFSVVVRQQVVLNNPLELSIIQGLEQNLLSSNADRLLIAISVLREARHNYG